MSYFLLSLTTTTTTSWLKAERKPNTFHDKHIQADQTPLKNIWHSVGRYEEASCGGGRERPISVQNSRGNGCAMAIVRQMYLFFNSNAKLALFFRTALSWENELGQITNTAWFNLLAYEDLKKWAPMVRKTFHIGLQVATVWRDIDSFNRYCQTMVNCVDICNRGVWDSISFYKYISFYIFH